MFQGRGTYTVAERATVLVGHCRISCAILWQSNLFAIVLHLFKGGAKKYQYPIQLC